MTVTKHQLDEIDKRLKKLIADNDSYKAKYELLQSVPGVGEVVTFNLLSDMPKLGYLNNKQAAALVGVAPMNRESGHYCLY